MTAWRNGSLVLIAILVCTTLRSQLAHSVDPFLGIEGGGNTLPGPSLPFGMIKPGPDVGANEANSGWEPTGTINGFSQTPCQRHRRRPQVREHPGAANRGHRAR